jgi:hypothetical protein
MSGADVPPALRADRRLIIQPDTTNGGSYRQNGTPVTPPRPSSQTTEQRSTAHGRKINHGVMNDRG